MIESVSDSDVVPRSRENSVDENDHTEWIRNPGVPKSPGSDDKEETSLKRGHAKLTGQSIEITVLDDNPRAPKTVQGAVLTLRKRKSNNALTGFRKFVWKLGWILLGAEQLSLYKTNDYSTMHTQINLIEVVRVSVDTANASVSVHTKEANLLFRLFDEMEAQEWRKCIHFNVNRMKTQKSGPKHAQMLGTKSSRHSIASPLTNEMIKIEKRRRQSLGAGMEQKFVGHVTFCCISLRKHPCVSINSHLLVLTFHKY